MVLRWAASAGVILLSGWVLVYPPPLPNGKGLDVNAPIGKWEPGRSYDTARDCEDERLTQAVLRWPDEPPMFLASAVKAARCVPAATVYPPNPAPSK